jgi:hypothetical protein
MKAVKESITTSVFICMYQFHFAYTGLDKIWQGEHDFSFSSWPWKLASLAFNEHSPCIR